MNKPRSILVLTDVHHTSAVSVHLFRLSLVACSSTFYREEFQEIEGQCLAIGRRYCSLIREPDGASWDSICTLQFLHSDSGPALSSGRCWYRPAPPLDYFCHSQGSGFN